MHLPARGTDEALGTRQHFLRGSTRKRQEENPVRSDSLVDQVGYAVDERTGLPGPGARDDEQRAISVRSGGGLLGVEVGGKVAGRCLLDDAVAGWIDARCCFIHRT
jgi:hypothetical protein